MKKQYKKKEWLLYIFVKVKLSCQIKTTIGMTWKTKLKQQQNYSKMKKEG